jgi:predicted RNase H-like HicB family nuclease
MRYPIAIEIGDEKSAYGVVVPDLPGCFSAGDTLDEAISNAEEAILAWMEAEETLIPPHASKIDDLRRNTTAGRGLSPRPTSPNSMTGPSAST